MTQHQETMAKLDQLLKKVEALEELSKPNPALLPERGLNDRPAIPPGMIPFEVMEAADPALGPDSENVIAYARENFSPEDFETFFPHATSAPAPVQVAESPGEAPSADEIASALEEEAEAEASLDEEKAQAALG